VGQEEEPLPPMRGADLGRAEQSPLRIEPELGQRPTNEVEASNNEGSDVLHEDVLGSNLANDPRHLEPESRPLAFEESGPLAGVGDVLAREAANDAIHDATPRSAVEGSDVSEDRRLIQGAVLHARRKDRGCIGFPLHSTDEASVGDGQLESEVESSDPAEQAKDVEGTRSHIQFNSLRRRAWLRSRWRRASGRALVLFGNQSAPSEPPLLMHVVRCARSTSARPPRLPRAPWLPGL
jgi:hypothetical protein